MQESSAGKGQSPILSTLQVLSDSILPPHRHLKLLKPAPGEVTFGLEPFSFSYVIF